MRTLKTTLSLALIFLFGILIANLTSAVIVNNIEQSKLYPGEEGTINIEIKNTLNQDVEDVSLTLDLSMMPFSTIGSSEKDVDELNEDDKELFEFSLKPSQDIKLGEYNIPYVISYKLTEIPEIPGVNQSGIVVKRGTFGVTVGAKTELAYSVITENPIVGQKGKVTLKIINRGLGDIKFVNVKIIPEGFTLISSNENYIGTVSSNDFETAVFDVIFNSENPTLSANVRYKDFENKDYQQNVNLPFTIYTPQKALELGIIQKSNATMYVGIIITLILIYILYRILKKRKKKKQQEA